MRLRKLLRKLTLRGNRERRKEYYDGEPRDFTNHQVKMFIEGKRVERERKNADV